MTTKTLTGTYASGYTMTSPVTDLIVATTGLVEGNGIVSPWNGHNAYGLVNYGKVTASNLAIGVYLYSGGSVTNGAASIRSAKISGGLGVIIGEAAGTVVNFGSIQGLGASSGGAAGNGVILAQGGTVTNGTASDTTALISGATAVATYGRAGTVNNFGTLKGTSAPAGVPVVYLHAGGRVTNGSATNTTAYIGGANGQHYLDPILAKGAAATVTNFGSIVGAASYINNGGGLSFYLSKAINLKAGGMVTNGTSLDTGAFISGTYGIVIGGGAGTVINDGSISSYSYASYYVPPGYNQQASTNVYIQGVGVSLGDGGAVTNGATADTKADIYAGQFGVQVKGAAGTVRNFGTIQARSDTVGVGVDLAAGGRVINGGPTDRGAIISGYNGITHSGGGALTVVNYGTISGTHNAVLLTSASDRLIIEAGCQFVGGVAGGGGTLELAKGTGAISGLGYGFGSFVVDSGADWSLSGYVALAGQKITDGGTLVISEMLVGDGVIGGAGLLSVAAAGRIEANGASALLLETHTVSSAGLLEGFGAGGLTLNAATVVNTGAIAAATGSRVLLKGATIKGGTLMTAGTGVIETTVGVNVLDGTGSAVTNDGAVRLLSGTGLTLEGVIGGTGVITLATAAEAETLTIGSMGATLTGGGEISLGNAAGNSIIGASGTATLTNAGDKIIGAGQLGSGELTLINDKGATILGRGSTGLTIDTGTAIIVNGGLIEASADHVTVKTAIANTGTLLAYNGGTLTLDGAITGNGRAKVESGTLDIEGSFSQTVTFAGGAGTLELAHSQAYGGTVANFSLGGGTALDLEDIGYTKGVTTATFKENAAGTSGVLTVTDRTHTAKITLAGNFSSSTFTTSGDGHGGTKVVDPPASASAALFASQAASMGVTGQGSADLGVQPASSRLLLASSSAPPTRQSHTLPP